MRCCLCELQSTRPADVRVVGTECEAGKTEQALSFTAVLITHFASLTISTNLFSRPQVCQRQARLTTQTAELPVMASDALAIDPMRCKVTSILLHNFGFAASCGFDAAVSPNTVDDGQKGSFSSGQ